MSPPTFTERRDVITLAIIPGNIKRLTVLADYNKFCGRRISAGDAGEGAGRGGPQRAPGGGPQFVGRLPGTGVDCPFRIGREK